MLPENVGAPETLPAPLVTAALPLTNVVGKREDERVIAAAAPAFRTEVGVQDVDIKRSEGAMHLARDGRGQLQLRGQKRNLHFILDAFRAVEVAGAEEAAGADEDVLSARQILSGESVTGWRCGGRRAEQGISRAIIERLLEDDAAELRRRTLAGQRERGIRHRQRRERSGVVGQSGKPIARLPADGGEMCRPLTIFPSGCTIEWTALIRIRIKRIGQSGCSIETGNADARLSADAGKYAARQDLFVRLHRDE